MVPHRRNKGVSIDVDVSWADICFHNIALGDVIYPNRTFHLPSVRDGADPVMELLLHCLRSTHHVEHLWKVLASAGGKSQVMVYFSPEICHFQQELGDKIGRVGWRFNQPPVDS